jgi:hypothetical protein
MVEPTLTEFSGEVAREPVVREVGDLFPVLLGTERVVSPRVDDE